ncbi:MAG: hypothetical protein JWP27_676 [Flaviaesturariibacter sp.]|nr:hypothetical protein [Flaviaesturariibacter sp.]
MLSLRWWRVATVLYFTACCILFFLPGSALPQESWLDAIYADKIVHVGLFAVASLLLSRTGLARTSAGLFAWLAAYGLAVEIVQGLWVPNRSCDMMDWVVDLIGALAGLFLAGRWAKK